jgi:nucleotide-binding universal stress UspA family protein
MYQRILLAYDGSAYTIAALNQATSLASLCGASLHILSIVPTTGGMAIAEAYGPEDVWGLVEKSIHSNNRAVIDDLRTRGLAVTACVTSGNPAHEINRYACEIDADLVVIGHTGKGLLSMMFQGSVGMSLLEQLPCSLLVATRRKQ